MIIKIDLFFSHGTHCTGTICGNNGIGVAPKAKWMACRGCDTTGIKNTQKQLMLKNTFKC